MFNFLFKKIKSVYFLIYSSFVSFYKVFFLKPKLKSFIKKTENSYTNKDIIEFENFAKKAYEIAIKIYGKDSSKSVEAISNNGLSLLLRKDFEASKLYFEKAIKLNLTSSYPNMQRLCEAYDGLGNVYREKGDFQKSLNFRSQVSKIAKANNDDKLSPYLFELARTNKVINNFKEAVNTYFESISEAKNIISFYKNNNTKFYKQILYYCYNDLSEIYISKGDMTKAQKYHSKAIEVLSNQKNFFEAHKQFEIPAKIFIKEEKYEVAIEQLLKAEKEIIEEYQGFEAGKDQANIIHQIGDCYIQLKQYNNALLAYQKALIAVCNSFKQEAVFELPAIEDIYNKRSAIASLSFKASTFLLLYNHKKDVKHLQAAHHTYQLITQLIPITRRDYVEENSKFQLADETRSIYEKAINTCLQLHQLTKEQSYLELCFYYAESSKAIVLQENLQANFALKGIDETVQQKDIEFRSKIAFYQNSINTNKTTEGSKSQVEDWETDLFKLKEAYERFQKQVEENFPNYYKVKYADSIANIQSIQKTLALNTALIKYFIGAENIYVFVITTTQFFVYTLALSNESLEKDVQQFIQLIYQPERTGSTEAYQVFRNALYRLYKNLLLKPLRELNNSVKRLIIIPDGLIYNISFDALLFSEKEHKPPAFYGLSNLDYLHKKFVISYNYSATILLNTINIENKSHENIFSGFAPSFENLENNITEVEEIKTLMGGTNNLNKAANFENFKLSAKKSKILHLSTHAKQHESNHKLSEIDLSDAVINNYHIENMPINADLTVLSACKTAAGLLQSGEGAMSLSRSFFLAGCPSLISSLWRANDESTADIMLYFYQYLKAGDSKDKALQKAKLQYCEEAGIRENHPFYWAGFILSGNRKALFKAN